MSRRIGLKFTVINLIVVLVLSGCVGPGQGGGTPSATSGAGEMTLQSTTQPGATMTMTGLPELPVKVISQSVISDLQGNVHILGEVRNESDSAAEAVSLTLVAYDAAGASLLRTEGGESLPEASFDPLVSRFATGQKVPYDYVLPPGSQVPATFQVFVTAYQPSDVQLLTLQIENPQLMVDANGAATLAGELVNPGAMSVNVRSLAGVLTGKDGSLISASGDWIGAGMLLPAGDANLLDRAPFKIRYTSALTNEAAWQIFVDAEPAGELDSTQFAIDQAASYYEDSRGDGHLVSSIKNPGEQSFSVQILAGLYGSTGVVMDVGIRPLPVDLGPGEEIPFDVHDFSLIDGHPEQQAKLANYTLQVDLSRTVTSNQVWEELTPQDTTQIQGEAGVWTYAGSVTNTLGTNFGRIVVMGILSDRSTGKVVAVSTAMLTNPAGVVEPGMRMDYSFEVLADPNETAQLDSSVRVYALID